jgi:hypothetical protein
MIGIAWTNVALIDVSDGNGRDGFIPSCAIPNQNGSHRWSILPQRRTLSLAKTSSGAFSLLFRQQRDACLIQQ